MHLVTFVGQWHAVLEPSCCSLQDFVQAGQQLLGRWGTRNEATAQLDAVIEDVSGLIAPQLSPGRAQAGET